jgi:hypothetical protein
MGTAELARRTTLARVGHFRWAQKPNRAGQSDLYTQYPSKSLMASEKNNLDRRGWFEELYFGVATDVTAGGLLHWTAAAAQRPGEGEEGAVDGGLLFV